MRFEGMESEGSEKYVLYVQVTNFIWSTESGTLSFIHLVVIHKIAKKTHETLG